MEIWFRTRLDSWAWGGLILVTMDQWTLSDSAGFTVNVTSVQLWNGNVSLSCFHDCICFWLEGSKDLDPASVEAANHGCRTSCCWRHMGFAITSLLGSWVVAVVVLATILCPRSRSGRNWTDHADNKESGLSIGRSEVGEPTCKNT